MVQGGQSLHLARKRSRKTALASSSVTSHLDGDRPLHVDVFGLVDDAHAAGAEPVDDAVVAEYQAEGLTRRDAPDLVLVEQAAGDEGVDDGRGVVVAEAGTLGEEGGDLLGLEESALAQRVEEQAQRRAAAIVRRGTGATTAPVLPNSRSVHGHTSSPA